ncbi:hypothetical protein C8Q76DRAFT_859583 [Earliella scabrosa]|nr:hypothetical protein C8Q76DRAFT_859583 [Earliella scabrosa]
MNIYSPGHVHCENGLFHNAEPMHTHAHCKNCFRMRRCEGSDADWKLQRCAGCFIATFCSRACQKAHWHKGHKRVCNYHKLQRERATELSGNPRAWADLAHWIEFHHASLINATLACFLLKKAKIPDVTSTHLLHLSLNYRNDPGERDTASTIDSIQSRKRPE